MIKGHHFKLLIIKLRAKLLGLVKSIFKQKINLQKNTVPKAHLLKTHFNLDLGNITLFLLNNINFDKLAPPPSKGTLSNIRVYVHT